jgi:hypothetical protein
VLIPSFSAFDPKRTLRAMSNNQGICLVCDPSLVAPVLSVAGLEMPRISNYFMYMLRVGAAGGAVSGAVGASWTVSHVFQPCGRF